MRSERADSGGLFAVAGHREAAHIAYLGLHGLQHRGEGGVGLVVSDGDALRSRSGRGLVQEVLPGPELQALHGHVSLGQVVQNPGPARGGAGLVTLGRTIDGWVAVAMVGRFTNGARLRAELLDKGAVLRSGSDAELILHLLAHSGQRTFINQLVDALWKVEGAYAVLVCTADVLVAVRDPRGFWPLLQGRLGDATLLSTEECALRFAGAHVTDEVEPGEMLVLDRTGAQAVRPFGRRPVTACARELAALARSDSVNGNRSVHDVRAALGESLAREAPCPPGRVVVALPGGAEAVATGFGRVSSLPVERGLVRAPYTGRRFEEPASGVADFGTRLRFYAVPSVLRGREVVLVLATLSTGTDLKRVVRLLREAGAPAVHIRVATPLVRGACFYGVSGPTPDELAVHRGAQLAAWLGVATVMGLSAVALRDVLDDGRVPSQYCVGCFTGDYPLPPEEPDDQLPLFD